MCSRHSQGIVCCSQFNMSFSAKRRLFNDSMDRASSETAYSSASESTASSPSVYVSSGDSDQESLPESMISAPFLEYPVGCEARYGQSNTPGSAADGAHDEVTERSPSPAPSARDVLPEPVLDRQAVSPSASSNARGIERTISPCSPVPDPPRDGLPPLIKRRRFDITDK